MSTAVLAAVVAGSIVTGGTASAGVDPTTPSVDAAGTTLETVWSTRIEGYNRFSSPAVGDLDGDGVPEIVMGHQDGYVRAFELDGSLRWAAPAAIRDGVATAVDSSPLIHDLDGDGRSEVIVGAGSTWEVDQAGGVVAFDSDGSLRWRRELADEYRVWGMVPVPDGYGEGVFSSPSAADIDGDGIDEIVFGGWDLRIHALDVNGNELPGFPWWQDDTVSSSPAVADVDGDGDDEIIIGGDSSEGGFEDWTGGVVRVLDYRAGEVVQIWKQRPYEVVITSPAIGDVDGDGRDEVISTTGEFFSLCSRRTTVAERPECGPDLFTHDTRGDESRVFAWHLDDGTPLAGWPAEVGAGMVASPVLGDLDADGLPEVAVASRDGYLNVIDGDGSIAWRVDLPRRNFDQDTDVVPPETTNSTAVIADLTGDGRNDIALTNAFAFHVVDGVTHEVTTVAKFISSESTPAVFDVDGQRYVALGQFNHVERYTVLTLFATAGAGNAADWPVWRGTRDHQGLQASWPQPSSCGESVNPPGDPDDASSRGYWILDDSGTVTAIDLDHHGDLNDVSSSGAPLALAATPDGDFDCQAAEPNPKGS